MKMISNCIILMLFIKTNNSLLNKKQSIYNRFYPYREGGKLTIKMTINMILYSYSQ